VNAIDDVEGTGARARVVTALPQVRIVARRERRALATSPTLGVEVVERES
jgi:hypothetical protein